jgi:glycosyltransferase involved in cell wall biosynthesis
VGTGEGRFALFVGRLSAEKGLDTLIAAWDLLVKQGLDVPLKIIGDGPQAARVQAAAATNKSIQWLGGLPLSEALSLMGQASFLIMPSIWYETFGRTIVEAYAKGTPVIASKLGAMAELVDDGRTGLHFQPGDANDLATKVQQLSSDPVQLSLMRQAARQKYEQHYTAGSNYQQLLAIYERALQLHSKSGLRALNAAPDDHADLTVRAT